MLLLSVILSILDTIIYTQYGGWSVFLNNDGGLLNSDLRLYVEFNNVNNFTYNLKSLSRDTTRPPCVYYTHGYQGYTMVTRVISWLPRLYNGYHGYQGYHGYREHT